MREKWKALTGRERRLFAAAIVFLALEVLLRFIPGLRFSAFLCLCAAAVLFVLFVLDRAGGACSRCSPQASSSLPRWRQWSFAARLRRKQTNR